MNKIHLILLITLLLIILSSGCSSSRVINSVARIEKDTSAIKKELTDLKSNLDDKIQKLNADIQKNVRQIEKETSAIKKVDALESGLGSHVQKINTDIQEASSQIEKELTGLKSSLSKQVQKLNADVHETMSKQKLYWTIAILLLFLIIASTFFLLRYSIIRLGNILNSELTFSLKKLKNEVFQLDTKLVQVLEGQLENGDLQSGQEAELDHSLPIKVCEEIQRMRNRMKHMDQDDQATKVFRKRLESLEEKLNDMGYEISELEGNPFIEGMTVNAQFIADENLKDGERIISRVIKPQINYKGVLLQAAEVEVGQGV